MAIVTPSLDAVADEGERHKPSANAVDRTEVISIGHATPTFDLSAEGTAWAGRWEINDQPAARAALREAAAVGQSRVTLAEPDDATPRWWDVVLTRAPHAGTVTSVARDITEQHLREAHLRRIAYSDDLTGLLNRKAFVDELAAHVRSVADSGGTAALFAIDLDDFKFINDALGHDAGDALLVEAANRFAAAAPAGSVVGRLGGDEFAVVVRNPDGRVDMFAVAEALIQSMHRPVSYKGRPLDTRASIGATLCPDHGADAAELLKHADIALYAAKSFGRGGFTIYVPSMGSALRKRATALEAISDALSQHRLEACYVPKVDLSCGTILGFEAQIRLRAADGALISPRALEYALDDASLAQRIGELTFARVAENVRAWRLAGLPIRRVALNTAAAEYRSGGFAKRLLDRIRSAGLTPELFEVEVAETVLAGRGTDYIASALAELAQAGVGVSLDHFGTGSTSLAQLKHLPIQSVKIDSTFVTQIESDRDDQAIVRAVIGLANGLGFATGAAGIETPGQIAMLRSMGCTTGQGDLLGYALSSTQIVAAGSSLTASAASVDMSISYEEASRGL